MEDNNSKTRGIRPKQQISGLPRHSSLPFRAFSRLCPPAALATKSNFKIPLFIPSIFPVRWLLAYVEGQDSSIVGKGIKVYKGKRWDCWQMDKGLLDMQPSSATLHLTSGKQQMHFLN